MPTKQSEAAMAFSHTQHMEDMFWRFVRSESGDRLKTGPLTLMDLHAVYCAGFVEGVWTERVHPARMKKEQTDGR